VQTQPPLELEVAQGWKMEHGSKQFMGWRVPRSQFVRWIAQFVGANG
jgi:hypothetical protein